MNEQQLQEVYEMVDNMTFSRNKRNINRDFSDGVMMAELIHHYHPKIISVHNYPNTNSVSKKIENWKTLNNKVLKKIGITLTKEEIQNIANAVPNTIEFLLYQILVKFEKPDEEVRLTQQARRLQTSQSVTRSPINRTQPTIMEDQVKRFSNGNEGNAMTEEQEFVEIKKDKYWQNSNKQTQTINQQAIQLLDKIEKAYVQLSKLNELNKAKEEMLLNLEKKLEKLLFT